MNRASRLVFAGSLLWLPTVVAAQTPAPEIDVGRLTLEPKAHLVTVEALEQMLVLVNGDLTPEDVASALGAVGE